MRWEELSGEQLAAAVTATDGICILPVSCLEQHGGQLPVGTDMIIARELATRVARLEPAVVFPDFVFGQILEGRAEPGAIGLSLDLVLRVLGEVCAEIARNGFRRIVLVNGHGGNTHTLRAFVQGAILRRTDFQIYLVEPLLTAEEEAEVNGLWESERPLCHGGEAEASQILASRPDLVGPGHTQSRSRDRYGTLGEVGVFHALWFYADHPDHFCGDASHASAEKGEVLLTVTARALARGVAAIRADANMAEVLREFHDRAGT